MRRTLSRLWIVTAIAWGAGCRAGKEPAVSSRPPAAHVIETHSAELMAIPGVVGVYEGLSRGDTVIRVMLATKADSTRRRLPKTLDGYRVETEASGPIEPMRR